jgi:hypothetical protein
MRRLCLLALALVAGCGTPQEQCIARGTRELRTVDRLIAETEGNLKRGYALETVTRYEEYWGSCVGQATINGQPTLVPTSCRRERAITEQRPRAIDLQAEARKLEGLQAKRVELSRAAGPVIAQCKAAHPE